MEFLQGIGSKTGAMPLSNDIMYLFHIRPEAPGANFAGQDQAQLFKERLAQYGSYVAEIAASLTADSDIVYSPIEPLLLPWPWFRGRVVDRRRRRPYLCAASHAGRRHGGRGCLRAGAGSA